MKECRKRTGYSPTEVCRSRTILKTGSKVRNNVECGGYRSNNGQIYFPERGTLDSKSCFYRPTSKMEGKMQNTRVLFRHGKAGTGWYILELRLTVVVFWKFPF